MKKHRLAICLCYVIATTSSLHGREDESPTDKESDKTRAYYLQAQQRNMLKRK